jgi:hypothetical protein
MENLPPLDLVAIRKIVSAQLNRFEVVSYLSYDAKESDTAFDLEVDNAAIAIESTRMKMVQTDEWSEVLVIGLIEKVREENTLHAILTNTDDATLGDLIRIEEDKIIAYRFRSAVVPDLWSVDLESAFAPSKEMMSEAETYIAQNHVWFPTCGTLQKSKYIDEYLRFKHLPKVDRKTDTGARQSALTYLNNRLKIFRCKRYATTGVEIYVRTFGEKTFSVAGAKVNSTRQLEHPLIFLEKSDKAHTRLLKYPFATSIEKLSALFKVIPKTLLPEDSTASGALARLSITLDGLVGSSDQFTGRIGIGNHGTSAITWLEGITPPITFPKLLRCLPANLPLNKQWTVGDARKALITSRNRVEALCVSSPPLVRLLDPIYHLTHVRHLPSIARLGILSGDLAHRLNLVERDISDPDVQRWRTSPEPCFKRRISAYVPLFINPSSPMLYKRRALRDELVVLQISADILAEADHVYSDGNAASTGTSFSYGPGVLEDSWHVLAGKSWSDYTDGTRRRSAEVLVFPSISPRFIVGAYCTNSSVAAMVKGSLSVAVTVNPSIFFWN